MIFDQHSKIFKKFLRPLNIEEHVTNAANMHACKHHHPVLNERQVAQFLRGEATRKLKIEKKRWSRWEEEKPQLCMEVCDPRQQRMAQTLIQGQPIQDARVNNVVEYRPDHRTSRSILATVQEDRDEKIHCARGSCASLWETRMMANLGTSPIRSEQRGARSSAPTFQWLPDPWGSTLHEAGAPMGTPSLGAAAEIETSVNSKGWNWHDMPGETNDMKWFFPSLLKSL